MKTKDLRGMREIATIQGLSRRSVPKNRPQAAAELARLEHEKARLERELKMWLDNQQKTEARLSRVEERLALVNQVLTPLPAEGSTKPSSRRRARIGRSPTAKADSGEGEEQGWKEIPLEY
jgi:chromosome segregation ATPase